MFGVCQHYKELKKNSTKVLLCYAWASLSYSKNKHVVPSFDITWTESCKTWVVFITDETEIKVVMVLPWRDNVWLHYAVTTGWPMQSAKYVYIAREAGSPVKPVTRSLTRHYHKTL